MIKVIGFWRAWALGVGMMIGSGIFTLPAVLAPFGAYSFVGWAVAAAGAISLVFSLSYMAARNPAAGGPYAYVQEAFGKYPAMITAWGYWISVLIAVPAIALAFTGYLEIFWPELAQNNTLKVICSLSIIWIFTFFSLKGVKEASFVQLLTAILKIIPLIVVGLAGLFVGDFTSIEFQQPHQAVSSEKMPFFSMLSTMLLLIMWSYIGIESATIPADNVINPKKTIPRALFFGVLTTTVIYVLALAGVMAIIPNGTLQTLNSPFAETAKLIFGSTGAIFIGIGALISIGGALNACVFLTGVVPSSGAKQGFFPRFFEQQTESGAATTAIIFSSVLASICIFLSAKKSLLGTFELMIAISTVSVFVVYFGAALASLTLQWRDQGKGVKIKPLLFINSLISIIFSGLALFGAFTDYF